MKLRQENQPKVTYEARANGKDFMVKKSKQAVKQPALHYICLCL